MFKLDLKKAEVALKAGRLDEAAGLLEGSKGVEHALGQQLKDRLVEELVKRGQQHLADDRLTAAGADVGLAKKLGGHQVAVLALEQQLESRQRSVAQGVRDRSLVEKKAKMESLLAAGEDEQTIRFFDSLSGAERTEPAIFELANKAAGCLVEIAWEDFNSGRLDRCSRTMQLIAKVQQLAGGAAQVELFDLLEKVQSARVWVGQARYAEAADELKKVQLVASDAAWITGALTGLQKCTQGLGELMTGALGLLGDDPLSVSAAKRSRGKQNKFPEGAGVRRPPTTALSCGRSILQVDQVGSLLLLAGEHFSIGTTSTKIDSDIVLQTEGMTEAVYIRRCGEDYLAVSGTPFVINGRSLQEHLLANGDSIEIGKRGRLTFSKPVAASNTAVLQIKGSKLLRRDIRSVVLVGDAVLFGDSASHFRIPGLGNRVIVRPVMQPTAGSGVGDAKSKTEFLIHQKGDSDPQLLRSGEQVVVGDCQFSLTEPSLTEPSSLIRQRSHS